MVLRCGFLSVIAFAPSSRPDLGFSLQGIADGGTRCGDPFEICEVGRKTCCSIGGQATSISNALMCPPSMLCPLKCSKDGDCAGNPGSNGSCISGNCHPKCPTYEWCSLPNGMQGMCLDNECRQQCKSRIQADCTKPGNYDLVFPCRYDEGRELGSKCFLDEGPCSKMKEGSACTTYSGEIGECRKLPEPEGNPDGTFTIKRRGPLVCETCLQFNQRALKAADCCTRAVKGTDQGLGSCRGCESNAECKDPTRPVCDAISSQCRCTKDSCAKGFTCYEENGEAAGEGEVGHHCSCNIIKNEKSGTITTVNCLPGQTCQNGKCKKSNVTQPSGGGGAGTPAKPAVPAPSPKPKPGGFFSNLMPKVSLPSIPKPSMPKLPSFGLPKPKLPKPSKPSGGGWLSKFR